MNQATGDGLEKSARRSECRNGRSDHGRGRFFRIQSAPGAFSSGGGFPCWRGGSGQNRGIKKAGRIAPAQFAFEQIRARARTDDSHRDGGNDRSGAGSDEEVVWRTGLIRHSSASRGIPLRYLKGSWRDPSTAARDDSLFWSYFTRTFLRRKVGTSRSWPSTIVGSLFSKRPRVMGSNCKISCFAAAAAFSRFRFSASTFGAINGFFFGGMIRGVVGWGARSISDSISASAK